MDDGQNDANADLDGQYALKQEIDAAFIRAERMRDRSAQIRTQSNHLREQADIVCKAARARIDAFQPMRRQGRQQTPDRHPTVDSQPA